MKTFLEKNIPKDRKKKTECCRYKGSFRFRWIQNTLMNLTRWNFQFSMVKYFDIDVIDKHAIDIDPTLQWKLNACKTHGSLSSLQFKMSAERIRTSTRERRMRRRRNIAP